MTVAQDSKGDLLPSHEAWWSCGGPRRRVLWAREAGKTGQVLSEALVGE